ncbi:MAG: lipocalin family protein [Rhodobacteraceae bacterium]|nr:lipocalin family protein [Paracoccaceae bacterium]
MLLTVAGCTAPGEVYRDASLPMRSTPVAPFAVDGRWYEVAGFYEDDERCAVGAVTLTVQPGGMLLLHEGPCADRDPRQVVLRPEGAGQFRPETGAPLWVLWHDAGYDAAVIGTPDGSLGYILGRSRRISQAQMAAARAALAANGYDMTKLRPTGAV